MSTLRTNEVKSLADVSLLKEGEVQKSVSTISSLLAVPTTVFDVVFVKEYHTDTDGGGVFYWDAAKAKSEHNGGTVIDPTAVFPTDWNNQTQLGTWFDTANAGTGCWVRQVENSGLLSVDWFGAAGDDNTDDTKAIQSTLDNAMTAYFPKGVFKVSDTLLANASIKGENQYRSSFSVVKMYSTTAKVILNGGENERLKEVNGVAFYGSDTTQRIHTGIYSKSYRCTFTNIQMRDLDIGMDIAGVYIWHEKLDISRTRIAYYPATLYRLDPTLGSTMFGFKDCVFNYNTTGMLVEKRYGGGGNSEDWFNVYMEGCGFEQGTVGFDDTVRIWNLTMVNCWFEAMSEYGLKITHTSTNLVEINNRHENNAPIQVLATRHSILSGNIESNSVFANSLRPKSDSISDPRTVGEGSITGRFQPRVNGSAIDSTEVYQFGQNSYASGTTNVRLSLVPNRGNNGERCGGFIEAFKPAATSSTGNRLELGVLIRDSVEAIKSIGVTIDRSGDVGLKSQLTSMPFGVTSNATIAPEVDATYNLGGASNRWNIVYASTGTINTSDAREKTFFDTEESEKLAALEIKKNLRKFKFNKAIETKGVEKARIHFGASAQQVGEILTKYGLNPDDYAFYCYDEWDAFYDDKLVKEAEVQTTTVDEDGNEIELEEPIVLKEAVFEKVLVSPAGNRYGIRYEELLSFILSAM